MTSADVNETAADAAPKPEANGRGAVVRVGPAGWSYDDWKGRVYPHGMPKRLHPVTYLAQFFDAIEINSTFYRPTRASYSAKWADLAGINPDFRFTAKLWQGFTHERERWPGDEAIRDFCRGIDPLAEAGKLGALLVQFPWSFKRTPENRKWLARVLEAFKAYPLAVEIRHASWNTPELYEGLAARNIAFCNIDQPLFRNSLAPACHVTGHMGYVRLHGRNADDWFRDDARRNDRYNYLYSPEELKEWVVKVVRIKEKASEVYAITNNHYEGQAVVNAFELQSQLGQPIKRVPEHLLEHYPRLRGLLT